MDEQIMKNKIIVGILILIMLVSFILLLKPERKQLQSNSSNKPEAESLIANTNIKQKSQYNSQPISYLSCRALDSDIAKIHQQFIETKKHNWDQFIEQGYSLDEITVAIDHFQNVNFATDWRLSQLKQMSRFEGQKKYQNTG
ncbi:MAG: hypothetical protein HWD86_00965 [Kangiellaceae bacterium]|nr:hypothetical protein [Kangiellaceae bacterium]